MHRISTTVLEIIIKIFLEICDSVIYVLLF